MQAFRQIMHPNNTQLCVTVPESFVGLDLEVLVLPLPEKPARKGYDFSDLVGQLKWVGNALEEQRRLRDEW